jgi:hypothetical protein
MLNSFLTDDSYRMVSSKRRNKISNDFTKHKSPNNNAIWLYFDYYLCNNGQNNIDKQCIMSLNEVNLKELLKGIKKIMKCDMWTDNEKKVQLSKDILHWRCTQCDFGNNCKNKLNYKCGYSHPCDDFIEIYIFNHYKLYPSYIPSGKKMKLYDKLFDINCHIDDYALNVDELRILPYNHRKIFTWLHIRIVTDLRKKIKIAYI